MLLVAAPIAAFALAMRTANRRAKRIADQVRAEGAEDAEDAGPSPADSSRGDGSAPGYVDTER